MELSLSCVNLLSVSVSVGVIIVVLVLAKALGGSGSGKKKPPGPPGWPVFGNMFDLGKLPHQTLYNLKSKYGPVLWMRLGSVNTMIIQSASAATVLFKEHDASFADRKQKEALNAFQFNDSSLGQCRFGAQWRVLRRLVSTEFMVNKRLSDTGELRRRMIDDMVRWIYEDSNNGTKAVEVGRFFFLLSFNTVGNLMMSKDLMDAKDPAGQEFFRSMNKIVELVGTPNMSDFLPWLKWLDPQGIKKKIEENMERTMKISSKYVQERVQLRKSEKDSNRKKDFLDTLLEYEGDGKGGPDRMTEKNVNILIMEMFFAGSETTSISIEWGFVELIRNPHVFKKVRDEIDEVVGLNRKVEESDIENMPYLQAVAKEALRLHPVIPLLLPRNSMEDTTFMGYHIPKNTQVFVNAWAIGRDPDSWEDPLTFKPERFLNSNIEYKGQHFELIPFGSGRRICVGFPLAQRLIHMSLASVVQAFDWELPDGLTPQTLDMEERLGLTLRKHVAMEAIPKRRRDLKF